MTQHHHGLVTDTAEAADESPVIGTTAITVQLDPGIADQLDVIEATGALGVAGHLNFLSWGQMAEDLLAATRCQGLELQDLLADIHF